jgi:hypothetical protein
MPDQEWIVADMRSLALGRRFNGILAWDSFFHLGHDDQRKMFQIFASHSGVNGMLCSTPASRKAKLWVPIEAILFTTQASIPPNTKLS